MVNRVLKYLKDRQGFSLVEVLVTVMIFAALTAAVATVLFVGQSSWQNNSVQAEMQQELRKAMDWMKGDLRETTATAITAGPTSADDTAYTSITFYLPTGVSGNAITWSANTTQFVLGGTGANELHRIENSVTRVIAHNIQSLGFRRMAAAPNIIEIILQAQKNTIKGSTVTLNLTFDIQMRN